LGERGIRFEFVVDEGGAVVEDLLPGAAGPVALLGIGEKGYLNVELVAEDAGGHSSIPPEHGAVGKLADAVTRLEGASMPPRLDVQEGLFEALGFAIGGMQGFALRRSGVFGPLLERRLTGAPHTNALIRTTGAATLVEGGVKPNILPQSARAVFNYRILPGDSVDDVLTHVRNVVGDDVEVRVLPGGFTGEPSSLSEVASASYRLVAETILEVFPEVVVAPWILMGATDSRHFIPIADNVYRFAPFRATPADMNRVHGTGERIRLADADGVVDFYQRLVRRACGAF
jgi:carboxypeptidase PM20D1